MTDGRRTHEDGLQGLEDACEEFGLLLRHVECALPPAGSPCDPHLPDLLRAGRAQLAVFEGEVGRLRRSEREWAPHHVNLTVILRRDSAYLRWVLGQFYREREGESSPN